MKKWNDTETATPKNGGYYLCCTKAGYITVKRFYLEYSNGGQVFSNCFVYTNGEVATNVAYWMEYPDPPEEITKGKEIDSIKSQIAQLDKRLKALQRR